MEEYDYYEDDVDGQYEDQTEYGKEGEEEEEVEEEEQKPSPEELEYLELRQRIKDQIRKKRQRETGSKNLQNKSNPVDNFGSFFGPSQPVIAQRVIQESKTLLENPQIADRIVNGFRTSSVDKKASTSNSSKKRMHEGIPKAKREVQKKVQQLKDTRDYSFLFSDNTSMPAPSKESKTPPAPRPKSSSYLQAPRTAPVSQGNKQSFNAKPYSKERKLVTGNGVANQKVGTSKALPPSKPASGHVENTKHAAFNDRKPPDRLPVSAKGSSSNDRMQKHSGSSANRSVAATASHCKKAVGDPSVHASKSAASIGRSVPSTSGKQHAPKFPTHSVHKAEMKKPLQDYAASAAPKQPIASHNNQVNRPNKPNSSHPLKKPARHIPEDEDARALQEIRKMFNTKRYAHRDDDDSDMEANFDQIMREERISSKIGRREDEEQMRLIEEEERRERARKMAKKRKIRD